MIKPDEVVTIDELSAALKMFSEAAKLGMPISTKQADETRELVYELRMRKAIRDEILRIAEEMAEEEEDAWARFTMAG